MMSIRKRNPCATALTWLMIGCMAMGPVALVAQPPPAPVRPPPSGAAPTTERLHSVNFRDAPLDQVLNFYSELTGRTMIRSPGINATITLRGQTRLTDAETLQAIEAALLMHNVALVPMGDKFYKVVQPATVRQEGLPIEMVLPEEPFAPTDTIISQIIDLKHLEVAEVQPIIQQLVHGYGKIQTFERTNSLLITDTANNMQRVLEVLEYIDRPVETREDIFVRELRYAEAGQVAARLNELIADQQAQQTQRPRAAATPPTPGVQTPPGVIRARPETPVSPTAVEAAAELAERGVIQGRVKIVADERINTLFIISRPVNFAFFDNIIDVLDRPIDPEIIVRVIALEYAAAEDIAGILNEFIGAASADAARSPALAAGTAGEDVGSARAEALRDFVTRAAQERVQQQVGDEAAKIGRLSAQTKILSDKRTNSLLLMGRRSDITVLEEIIDQLDVMLGQVLIEAVILEVNLNEGLEYGLSWLQRSMMVVNEQRAGPAGGIVVRDPVAAFGGGFDSRDGSVFRDASLVDRGIGLSPGALTYFTTLYDFNIDAIIRLAASSGDARILSTPVILTTDNTEAKIIIGESRPIVTSTASSTVGDRTVSSYQYRDIGINLTVTPRINPQRFVVMDISQQADDVGDSVTIDGNEVPIITRREFSASIAVGSRSTIALGGLIRTDERKTRVKVPILGDIPLLGALFRADTMSERRTELMVLITPYVIMTSQEARSETYRLHANSHSSRTQWHAGWSDSPLARPETAKEFGQAYEDDVLLRQKRYDSNQRQRRTGTGRDMLIQDVEPLPQMDDPQPFIEVTPNRDETTDTRPTDRAPEPYVVPADEEEPAPAPRARRRAAEPEPDAVEPAPAPRPATGGGSIYDPIPR